ncbi:MAG TPA: hypothetical protein VHF69_07465 [Candidatus Synoicihabitans sp.]|nr:hypothetical protein [Candidatus Synoicihabitans sp.]
MSSELPGTSGSRNGVDEMTFNNRAYIYLGMGEEDPAVDRAVIERGGLRTTMVAVPEKSAAMLDEFAWWIRTLKAGRVEEAMIAKLVGAAR